jgi:multidrug efflux pump subunit AcrA (membrane-fusion protein)
VRIANALVMMAAVSACAAESTYDKPPTPVTVQTVQLIASASGTRYSASIEPGTEIPMAFRASGYVESLAVASGRPIDAGDRVIAGQVLARVRPADVDEQVNRARAQLAEAQAGRGAAQATFE